MNPINPQNKILGVALGLIVLGSVSYVTMFGEKKPNDPLPTQMYTDALPQNNQPATPSINNIAPTKPLTQRFFGDDEGEDGGGNIPNQPIPTPPPVTTTKPTTKTTSSVYKDGTYSAIGSYMSPGGNDQIGIKLTLSKDIITSVSATNMAGDGRSVRYQDQFISGFQPYVVGQKISTVYLTKVSGASLTPKGFNDAINQIKSQAKA